MYLCVRVRVYVWGRRSWEKRKRVKIKNKETGEKRKHKLIHTDKQTNKQTDRQTDRHKSFIDMRYYTEQYSKSNPIELK